MKINLHIDRLVLDGVSIATSQQHLLQASVTGELTRMLTEGGVSPSLTEGSVLSRVVTNGIQLNDGRDPTQIGQQIAQSVYGGIGN